MMKNSRRSNALRRYLRLLEAYCPDTLHVWMPRFDGRRTSSATYDLVSGTALNLGSGAAFSGDGKYVVLDDGEIATATITTRGYIYLAFVFDMVDWSTNEYVLHVQSPKNVQLYYNGTYKELSCVPSYDGSSDDWSTLAKVGWPDGMNFVAWEVVVNASEFFARSPQEAHHIDKGGITLYSASGVPFRMEGQANFAAAIYGGATTSAPLESLAGVVKSGESGALLTEMFRELI